MRRNGERALVLAVFKSEKEPTKSSKYNKAQLWALKTFSIVRNAEKKSFPLATNETGFVY